MTTLLKSHLLFFLYNCTEVFSDRIISGPHVFECPVCVLVLIFLNQLAALIIVDRCLLHKILSPFGFQNTTDSWSWFYPLWVLQCSLSLSVSPFSIFFFFFKFFLISQILKDSMVLFLHSVFLFFSSYIQSPGCLILVTLNAIHILVAPKLTSLPYSSSINAIFTYLST